MAADDKVDSQGWVQGEKRTEAELLAALEAMAPQDAEGTARGARVGAVPGRGWRPARSSHGPNPLPQPANKIAPGGPEREAKLADGGASLPDADRADSRPSRSWPCSAKAKTKSTSARTSKRCSASRRRSGWKIRFSGTRSFIPTTVSCGIASSRAAAARAVRSAPSAASWRAMDVSVWVRGEARLVRDDFGRPLFLQGVAFDITEAKRAEARVLSEAVRTTEERYRDLVEQLGAIFWEADVVTPGFSFVSRGAEQVLGYSPRRVAGRSGLLAQSRPSR